MKNSIEIQREISTHQAEMAALQLRKGTADQEYQELLEQRAKAIRALASGNGAQRKTLLSLEEELKPLTLHLEGLAALISDAQVEVDQAKATLEEVEAQEAYDFLAWARAKETAACEAICLAAPARKEEIFNLFIEICKELGQLRLDQVRVDLALAQGIGGPNSGAIKAVLETLPGQLGAMMKESGLRSFLSGGFFGTISVWPMLEVDPDLAHAFPGAGAVDVMHYARLLAGEINAARLGEFKAEKGLL